MSALEVILDSIFISEKDVYKVLSSVDNSKAMSPAIEYLDVQLLGHPTPSVHTVLLEHIIYFQ